MISKRCHIDYPFFCSPQRFPCFNLLSFPSGKFSLLPYLHCSIHNIPEIFMRWFRNLGKDSTTISRESDDCNINLWQKCSSVWWWLSHESATMAVILLVNTQKIIHKKIKKDHCRTVPIRWCLLCTYVLFFGGFVGAWATQIKHK